MREKVIAQCVKLALNKPNVKFLLNIDIEKEIRLGRQTGKSLMTLGMRHGFFYF